MKSTILKIRHLIELMLSMAGFVPRNATIMRTVSILLSLLLAHYFSNYHPYNTDYAFFYFTISEILYIGFISVVLSENGLRHTFHAKWNNEDEAYKAFEAILGFLFFHNAVSIGYIASSTPGNMLAFINQDLLLIIVTLMFIAGFLVKISAANVVSIEIYYWKDMFLGRKITDFVISGPYKYLKNPMYGIGQLPAYAVAMWYGSVYGLMAAVLNQILIFSFYYFIERRFIKKVYVNL